MSEWLQAPVPFDELDRLARLSRLGVRLGQAHAILDTITAVAARDLDAPVALVSIVDTDEQWYLSRHGLDIDRTGRAESFCGHAITARKALIVHDAYEDHRFQGNPVVTGGIKVRSYIGIPLYADLAQSGLGTLCVIDRKPRLWSQKDLDHITLLAKLVEGYLDSLTYQRAWNHSPLAFVIVNRDGRCLRINPAFSKMLGRPTSLIEGQILSSSVLPGDRSVLATMLAYVMTHRESPTRRELRFMRLDGEVISGGVSIAPIVEVQGHAVVGIRDISLERKMAARSGVVAEVRAELTEPLSRARARVQEARARGTTAEDLNAIDALLDHFGGLIDARIGDIASRMRVEAELTASEQRVRTLMEHILGPLLVIDDRGRIVDANSGALDELGWRYDDLVGASLRVVNPGFTHNTCARWFRNAEAQNAGSVEDVTTFVRRDGTELCVEPRLMCMDWNGPHRLVIIARDVTAAHTRETTLRAERDDLMVQIHSDRTTLEELQRMEVELKQSLDEKETMLKEIHHRVKNNLQMVSSILTLQMDQVTDARIRESLADSVRRVRSMALIHQHIYGSTSLERVDLGVYACNLAETLCVTLAPQIRLRTDIASVEVPVDKAVPFCLMLNELLTNAFKYGGRASAAPRPDEGWDVRVTMVVGPQDLHVRVEDRGRGLPEGFRLQGHASLGLQLVTTLVRQMRGKVSARNEVGALFEVVLPRA